MPQRVSVPKPAPIPEGVDIHAQPEQTPVAIEEPVSRVTEEKSSKECIYWSSDHYYFSDFSCIGVVIL